MVFQGSLQPDWFSSALPGNGWLTIPLDLPFFWDGTQNILIACDENQTGRSGQTDEFLAHDTTINRAILYKHNSINPDPWNPPPVSDTYFYIRTTRANIRFDIQTQHYHPYQPYPAVGQEDVPCENLEFSWLSDASSWDIYFGNTPENMELLSAGLTECRYNLNQNLSLYSQYYWKVIGHHLGQQYSSPSWSFRSVGEALSEPRFLSAIIIQNTVQLAWAPPLQGTIVEYEIHRNYAFYTRSITNSYVDYDVIEGATYTYYVKAVNYLNQVSSASNTVLVHVPSEIPNLILSQSFESFPAFTMQIPGWQFVDLDMSNTWAWEEVDFANEGNPMAAIVFDPFATVPPVGNCLPHSGSKMLMVMSSLIPPNNDWIILPRINLGEEPVFSFWARSFTEDFGMERLRVMISSNDALPSSFVPLSTGSYINVPQSWTHYSFDLSQYTSMDVYLAINCVSWDAFALFLDDFLIQGRGGALEIHNPLQTALPWAFTRNAKGFLISAKAGEAFDLRLYDLRGRQVFQQKALKSFDAKDIVKRSTSGMYILRISSSHHSETYKVILRP